MHTNSQGQGIEIRSEIWQLVTSTAESRTNNTEYCFNFLNLFFTSHKELLVSYRMQHHSTCSSSCQYEHSPRHGSHCLVPQNTSWWRRHFCQLIQKPSAPQIDDQWCPARKPSQSHADWGGLRWRCSPLQSRSQNRSQNFLASLCVNLDAWNLRGDGG